MRPQAEDQGCCQRDYEFAEAGTSHKNPNKESVGLLGLWRLITVHENSAQSLIHGEMGTVFCIIGIKKYMNFENLKALRISATSRFALPLLFAAISSQFITPVLATPLSDSIAPSFSDLFVSPSSLDVSTGTGSVLVHAHITDNLSGFIGGGVNFANSTAGNSYWANFYDSNRVSGTALDGWYENTVQVAQYSAQGTYSAAFGYAYDAANNWDNLSTADFAPYGAEFAITSLGDLIAPSFSDLFVSPPSLDVSTGTGSVLVRAHITDNLSGFIGGGVNFANSTAGNSYWANFYDSNRVSGTALDGWYENTVQVAQYSAQGTYSAAFGYAYDAANNWDNLSTADFAPYGAEFAITSLGDLIAPSFSDLFVSPSSLDVSTGTGSVLVRAHITDNLSGFIGGGVNFANSTAGNSYWANFYDSNRVSGTALDGWYENTVQVAQYSAQGTYSAAFGYAYDAANNWDNLSTADFAPYGAEFNVGQIDVPEPPTVALFLLAALVGGVASRGRQS